MSETKQFSELQLLLNLNYLTGHQRVLVDVGAHAGFFAKPFAENGWRVIAFEPEPENHRALQANLGKYSHVTCIKKAVSDVHGQKVQFYTSSEHWGIHSLKPFHATHKPTLTVETARLDETLAKLQVDQVTLLKIDIEGADFAALKSFGFDRFHPEVVLCEFMDERSLPNFGYTHHDMAKYMMKLGYVPYVSEWSPIVEYGRKGAPSSAPHCFLQCKRYPLTHAPAWGNLIFIPQARVEQFEQTLAAYLDWLLVDEEEVKQTRQILERSNDLLLQYKDKHRGRRCVIIGNGPSLNKMDLSFLKDEITFGMNRIYLGFKKWGFTPTYFVSVNPLVIEQSAEEILKIPAPKFLSLKGFPYIPDPTGIVFLKDIHKEFFSDDPRNGIWEGHTVTYVAMQLAYFMGFTEVVLIGVDHYFETQGPANVEVTVLSGNDPNHFHPGYFGKGVRWQLPDLKNSEVAYRLAKQAFEADRRSIVDATVGGKLTIFPKVDYHQIFVTESSRMAKKGSTVYSLTKRGVDQYVQGNMPGAEKTFKAALEKAPQNVDILVSLGTIYYNMQRYEEALIHIQKAIDINPNNAEAWIGVALIAKQVNDELTFKAACQQVRILDPKHPKLAHLDRM